MAALRNHRFFSLAELNKAIYEKLMIFNQRPLQKMKASRQHLFETIDKPALAPLPAHRYEFAQWKKATVNIDYHVEVDHHYYSVPYQLRGKKLDVSSTATTVTVFHKKPACGQPSEKSPEIPLFDVTGAHAQNPPEIPGMDTFPNHQLGG